MHLSMCLMIIAQVREDFNTRKLNIYIIVPIQVGVFPEVCISVAVQMVSFVCGFDVACTQVLSDYACLPRSARALAESNPQTKDAI